MVLESVVVEKYKQGRTIREIADELNSYPMYIYRILKKYKQVRDKKEATLKAQEMGRYKPRRGKSIE